MAGETSLAIPMMGTRNDREEFGQPRLWQEFQFSVSGVWMANGGIRNEAHEPSHSLVFE